MKRWEEKGGKGSREDTYLSACEKDDGEKKKKIWKKTIEENREREGRNIGWPVNKKGSIYTVYDVDLMLSIIKFNYQYKSKRDKEGNWHKGRSKYMLTCS